MRSITLSLIAIVMLFAVIPVYGQFGQAFQVARNMMSQKKAAKKAQKENKIPTIVQALQKSIIGRKDKTRALVQELQSWQNDGYVDAHYNARVMYDELNKITPLTFEYDTFRKYYNNLI